jgi:hypothetical protein
MSRSRFSLTNRSEGLDSSSSGAYKILIFINLTWATCAFGSINYQFNQDTVDLDYKLLVDSLSYLEFGQDCGLTGNFQPIGREEISRLISKQKYSLIKSVLDGYNNVGKVYAIEALLELNMKGELTLTETDKLKIKTTIEEDFEIEHCLGCESETTCTLLLFEEGHFKRLLESNNIKINYH